MSTNRTTFFSTAVATIPQRLRARPAVASITRSTGITRRHLQVALGLFWLLDGALQAQPFMFTRGFATQLITGVGEGQPGFVSGPVHLASTVIAANPVVWNLPFAGFQLLLGIGLLVPRTARLALAASIAWALGVWYVGEGLSGMASGHASLVTGAPGSALIYALLAAAAWPREDGSREGPAPWLPFAWAGVWVGAAVFQALPGQNTGMAVASTLTAGTEGAPAWLAGLDSSAGSWAAGHGLLLVIVLVAAEALIGVGALSRRARMLAVALGLIVALAFWAGVGKVLVDSNGMTLYYFEKDQKGSGKSKCEGACAGAWPPLTTSGAPEPMSGVNSSMLGTIERTDGTMQVTYAGWPLYTFVEDKKPGEDNGTDSKAFGASWYPLHSNGEKAGH